MQAKGIEASDIPGEKGQFDVIRDGVTIFSKRETGRFPDQAEIFRAFGAQ